MRLTLQDQDIERNVEPVREPGDGPEHRVARDAAALFYKLNPQTVLFAGYSDNQLDDELTGNLEMTGRTLFFKLSYAWTP